MSFVALSLSLIASNNVFAIFGLTLSLLTTSACIGTLCCPGATASRDSCAIMNAARTAPRIGLGGQNSRDQHDDTKQPYCDDTPHVGVSPFGQLHLISRADPQMPIADAIHSRVVKANTRLSLGDQTLLSTGGSVLRPAHLVLVCRSGGSLASYGCFFPGPGA